MVDKDKSVAKTIDRRSGTSLMEEARTPAEEE
jgi:hypothetical protein